MLIPSHRHTAADLELWAELEEADQIFGRSQKLTERVRRSIVEITAFASAGSCYAGVSWGKDSVVLASLIAVAAPQIPLIWLTYGGANNPDCAAVRDAFLRTHANVDYREIDVGSSKEMRDDFSPAARSAGSKRYLSGVRADESGVRRMSVRNLGLKTETYAVR